MLLEGIIHNRWCICWIFSISLLLGFKKSSFKKVSREASIFKTLNLKYISNLYDFKRTTQVFVKHTYKCYEITGDVFWTSNVKIKIIIFHQYWNLKLTFKAYCIWQSFNAEIIIDIKYAKSCAFFKYKTEVHLGVN